MSHWLLLTPREVDLVTRPLGGDGENAELLRTIAAKVDKISGELTLTGAELERARSARRNYRLGGERQLTALLEAADRHGL